MKRLNYLAWLPEFRGVDQIDVRHSELPAIPHRMTPRRSPDCVGATVHPAVSASCKALSTFFFGCLDQVMLTRYNSEA
ncbi:MAG: hypothetical protein OXC26_12055 [Albidovulum sp.]|nr:hypothetical protein [Albidovulum sp.]